LKSLGGLKMEITMKSGFTGKINSMDLDVTLEQMEIWNSPNRPLIQEVFPNLSSDEREFIKTGVTPEEWKNIFGEEEE